MQITIQTLDEGQAGIPDVTLCFKMTVDGRRYSGNTFASNGCVFVHAVEHYDDDNFDNANDLAGKLQDVSEAGLRAHIIAGLEKQKAQVAQWEPLYDFD